MSKEEDELLESASEQIAMADHTVVKCSITLVPDSSLVSPPSWAGLTVG